MIDSFILLFYAGNMPALKRRTVEVEKGYEPNAKLRHHGYE